jgi:hypothetical protein
MSIQIEKKVQSTEKAHPVDVLPRSLEGFTDIARNKNMWP